MTSFLSLICNVRWIRDADVGDSTHADSHVIQTDCPSDAKYILNISNQIGR